MTKGESGLSPAGEALPVGHVDRSAATPPNRIHVRFYACGRTASIESNLVLAQVHHHRANLHVEPSLEFSIAAVLGPQIRLRTPRGQCAGNVLSEEREHLHRAVPLNASVLAAVLSCHTVHHRIYYGVPISGGHAHDKVVVQARKQLRAGF